MTPFRSALVGVPNCGKTALFNRLTGSRQKVANYPGVSVERKEGAFSSANRARQYQLLDLPGTYSLVPATLDEAITRDAVRGKLRGEASPDLIVCVVDATNLRLSLRLVLELGRIGRPVIVALNMSDLAGERGYQLNRARLESELGMPVVETVAVHTMGARDLIAAIDALSATLDVERAAAQRIHDENLLLAAEVARPATLVAPVVVPAQTSAEIEATQREARRILSAADYVEPLRPCAHASRRCGNESHCGADVAGDRAVRDLSGGVYLGSSANGVDQQRHERAGHCGDTSDADRCVTKSAGGWGH